MDWSWVEDAACCGKPVRLFFPFTDDREGPADGPVTAAAKKICAGCPVRQTCLEVALATGDGGIWGGTTLKERNAMKRRQPRRPRKAS